MKRNHLIGFVAGLMLAIAAVTGLAQTRNVKNYFAGCSGTSPCDNVLNLGGTVQYKNRGTVTQATSITTGVTLNATSGTITTVSQALAAGAEAVFTVTDSAVGANDVIVVDVADTAAGAGGPFMVSVDNIAAGSFEVAITNTHATVAGNSVLKINFAVIKSASGA